ncbi:hypothetical protein ANO11243_093620 [Dothideomycetidae sp. 11243]|nr:hypothetical protein ANO11243_093620 [fungal sp. No.11243]
MVQTVPCGKEARTHFAFDPAYTSLNHGSYGTYPVEIRSVLREYQERTEARPDFFIRYEYRTHLLDHTREAIAKYLDVPTDTCVLTPNASTGFDTIVRNLEYKRGDVIICCSTVYPAFENTLQYLAETTPVRIRKVEYTLPASDSDICDAFELVLEEISQKRERAKLAVFDTISTLPGVRMPFERLTALCRKNNILSCVDGAHGIGHIPLHLAQLQPDFLVSNCHKWLHVPRGCAVLYVPTHNQYLLNATLPVGIGFVPKDKRNHVIETTAFVANFASVGTLDDSAYLCTPAAIEWRKNIVWGYKTGEEAIIDYIIDLAQQGGRIVATMLGTEVMENAEGTLGNCGMTNVRLPISMNDGDSSDPGQGDKIAAWVNRTMNVEHGIAVNAFPYAGACWVRLSGQIYLELDDFERAGLALHQVCGKVNRGEWDS